MDCDKEEQEDEKLNGTSSDAGPVPEAPATVKGNKVVFGFELTGRLAQSITFKGAIESATRMTGMIGDPFCGNGCNWTATKKK